MNKKSPQLPEIFLLMARASLVFIPVVHNLCKSPTKLRLKPTRKKPLTELELFKFISVGVPIRWAKNFWIAQYIYAGRKLSSGYLSPMKGDECPNAFPVLELSPERSAKVTFRVIFLNPGQMFKSKRLLYQGRGVFLSMKNNRSTEKDASCMTCLGERPPE